MITLLDVSVLIPLGDTDHIHATVALRFFEEHAVRDGWATCALTENAFARILGRSVRSCGSTLGAGRVLSSMVGAPGHEFWPDELSVLNASIFPKVPASADLTDACLLALAVKNGGFFPTFDRRINPAITPGGESAICSCFRNPRFKRLSQSSHT